jgi:phosphate butyryltransferase
MITSLGSMVERVQSTRKKHRIAVAWAHDTFTAGAIARAVKAGFAEAMMIGNRNEIEKTCHSVKIDPSLFIIINSGSETDAAGMAVAMTRSGEADIAMKGLVGTDKFLKAVMDKERGIMLPGAVLTYTGIIEMPAYHKLLLITDPAVIPFPDLYQKQEMLKYALEIARRLEIDCPKVSLISASEKSSKHFPSSSDYEEILKLHKNGYFGTCIIDGPLDLFLSCDKKSVDVKGVKTPVDGDADILLFPSLESGNPFYKALMLFAGGQLGGIIRGTTHPVILMSRSESELSKFYCIALACFMNN